MQDIISLVKNFSDSEVIEVLNVLHADIFKLVPYQQIIENTSGSAEDVQALVDLNAQKKLSQVGIDQSIKPARALLYIMASNDQLAVFVKNAWEKNQESEHMGVIATIVTIGLLVNLTLLVATTEIRYKDGKWELHKKTATAEQIKAVVSPVKELAKKTSFS